MQLQLGAVNVFLSPRQLHAFMHLIDIFFAETSAKNTKKQPTVVDDDSDQNATQSRYNAMSGNLGLNQCWSSDAPCKFFFFIGLVLF